MHWDKHGIEGISIHTGTAVEKPTEFRRLSTWLGYDDLAQLVIRCIEAPKTATSTGPHLGAGFLAEADE